MNFKTGLMFGVGAAAIAVLSMFPNLMNYVNKPEPKAEVLYECTAMGFRKDNLYPFKKTDEVSKDEMLTRTAIGGLKIVGGMVYLSDKDEYLGQATSGFIDDAMIQCKRKK